MAKERPTLTTSAGNPVSNNDNSMTVGRRGPVVLNDYQLFEKIAHQNRERIPERVVHAKGWGAHGTFTVTNDITKYTRAKLFSKVGKQTPMLARFSTVAGEQGAAGQGTGTQRAGDLPSGGSAGARSGQADRGAARAGHQHRRHQVPARAVLSSPKGPPVAHPRRGV